MKIVKIKDMWLLHCCTKFQLDISSPLQVMVVQKVESQVHTYTNTYTHTAGRRLKITFLDVLDYSEYSDTNISNFYLTKQSVLSAEAIHINV